MQMLTDTLFHFLTKNSSEDKLEAPLRVIPSTSSENVLFDFLSFTILISGSSALMQYYIYAYNFYPFSGQILD